MLNTPKKRKASDLQDVTIEEPFNEFSLPDFIYPRALAAFIENSKNILGNIYTTDSINNLTYTN